MTPRELDISVIRGVTPSIISSPPPTVANTIKRESVNGCSAVYIRPTSQQISDASEDELRVMLNTALTENAKLEIAVGEARMSAAHYKLQYNMLSIETEEAAKRMEVEHNMTRREVAILQQASQNRVESSAPHQDHLAKVVARCQALEEENAATQHRLARAKKLIEMKDEEIEAIKEEKRQCLQRIKENREHLNILRSPGGIFHVATPKVIPSSYPATPQQYRATPKQTPLTGRSIRHTRDHSQEPFAALLLADQMLSQENNSAPSTPTRHPDHRTPVKHHRSVHSLSSLPNTPSARPLAANSTLLPSVQFTPRSAYRYSNGKGRSPVIESGEQRRKSRDSTISIDEVDAAEIARAAMSSQRDDSEEIQESQASQSATELLRMDSRQSFEVAEARKNASPTMTDRSTLVQTKIFGPVTKATTEKRKRVEDSYGTEYSVKRLRVPEEGVGLGIGITSSQS
ncbi:hypothetical protein F5884DRAFT_673628 [Xylogone sp. PMI_703]|nr:hypothetical protein F5884DRAFT_673628 [Xylogone sp. PMI_703]